MHTAAVAKWLSSRGLVVYDAAGTDCFLEFLPDQPVNAVAVYTMPAGADDLFPYGWVGAQVVVRDDGTRPGHPGRARGGHDRAKAIFDVLNGLRKTTMDPGGPDQLRVIHAHAQSTEPLRLGPDDNQVLRWSTGFELYVHRTGPGRFSA